jgi:glutamine amidotransferase-like uncharacterized protein
MKNAQEIFVALFLSFLLSACAGSGGSGGGDANTALPDTSQVDPANPTPVSPVGSNPTSPSAPSEAGARTYSTDVLLFNGQGISTSDWQSTESLVKSLGLTYKLVNSAQMNAMSLDQVSDFGLIIVPGGERAGIMSGLSNAAQLNIRQAVRDRGVSYLGFCAGAFAAVGTLAKTNTVSETDLGVIYGSHLANWWPNGNTSAIAAVVPVKFADGSSRSLVWWGGPATPEWSHGVIGRYSDGKPAISQSWFSKGFVILSGPHPEAPQGWRNTAGTDPDGLDYVLAKKLITASLERQELPTF